MAERAVAAVLSKFGELALREAKVLLEVGDDMLLLRDQLEWLQAFIRDADRKRRAGTDGLSRVWVGQTRDVAFEADDALDEFFYQVDMKSLGYRGWKIWRKYLTGFWTQIIVRHALSSRIQRIKNRLNQISENQKEYKLEHTPLVKMTSSTTDIAAWWDGYNNVVGFDNNVKTLKKMLLREDDHLMFISIFGDSGIGKLTLANVIYHDMEMMKRFDVPVFLIKPDCNAESLLKKIYVKIAKCQPENSIDISDKIHRLLANKRYLVILSGISSKTMLNCLRACLPDDNNGSSVMLILDTESEEVVWHANNMNKEGINGIHRLSRLDKEKSGELFCSRAFRKEPSDGKEEPFDGKVDKNKYDKIGVYCRKPPH